MPPDEHIERIRQKQRIQQLITMLLALIVVASS